jgi:hypothetical protein
MPFAYFLSFQNPPDQTLALDASSLSALKSLLAGVPDLKRALVFTPETAKDQFNDDGSSPPLALQLYFSELTALEAAVSADGYFAALTQPGMPGGVEKAVITQQAFYVRHYKVDDPLVRPGKSGLPCSYVVHYPGPAEDINAWLSHYVAHHPQIMRKFPGIRDIEILSRVDWCGGLPWPRANHIQRNRVMFDSPEALTAALQSPVRLEMRADFAEFPPYEGGNFHYPMATEEVLPAK